METSSGQIAIYQTDDGQVQLEVALEQDTVWLSQAQMAELFGRDQSVVSRYIRNALSEGEVVEKNNVQKMHIACLDIRNFQMAGRMLVQVAQSVVARYSATAKMRCNLREVLI